MLEVRLLGTFEVKSENKPITIPSRPAQSLFAYLILNAGTAHRREKLAGLFWPDSLEETARDNLRHALWRVRKALHSNAAERWLHAEDLSIWIETSSDYWLDTETLEKLSENADADELIATLSVYQGDLLPGFYDDWVLLEREHLSSVFEHHMARLMSLLESENRWLDILDWGERWIKLGQKPEPAYRALMAAHAAKGDMAKVAATYERCIKGLREFGVEPSELTQRLYEKLKAGEGVQPSSSPMRRKQVEAAKEAVRLTNLPVPLTSFVGRAHEVAEVIRLLEKNRLLTLTGSGGVGKTRLAIQSASKLIHTYKDGVWWVDLVGLSDELFLPQALAQVLNVREVQNQSLLETLVDHLQAKEILLVLDNCEHLITACAQLADLLLSRCRGLRILATSREALDILGETTWPVPSLSLPEDQETVDVTSLNEFESVRLFVERAEVIQPRFRLSGQNARAIMQICRRLSGMPLAIELAAARVKMMSIDEIAKRLDDRFSLLTSGNRTALPRHQTLRATIDWSYDLLSEIERLFFCRLSVFINGFTLHAAEVVTVGGGIEASNVVDLTGQLINKSLVSVDSRQEHPGEETHYEILETIREYARQKLDETGKADAVRDRHLAYYMELAETAQPEIFLSSQVAWFALLEKELDNLQAAMEWSMTGGQGTIAQENLGRQEAGLRLAAALAWFWERGYRREATERLQAMLAKMETMEVAPVHTMMFNAIGFLYWSAGKYKEARSYLEQAVATGRKFGKSLNLAWALNYLGATTLAQGDQQTAHTSLEEAFQMATGLGSLGKHAIGWALAYLGDIPFLNQNFKEAQSFYEMSILALGEVGNKNMKAYPLRRLGYLALYRQEHRNALEFFKESLLLNHELRHQVGTIGSIAAFGALAIAEENYLRSARLLGAVEANLEAMAVILLPSDRREYSRNVEVLRNQSGRQAITDAWNEGRSMTLEQAVNFALEG